MNNFITRSQISLTAKYNVKSASRDSSLLLAIIKKALGNHSTYLTSVFLSHSHNDSELIEDIISILTKLNISVYVDWLDDNLTYPPSGKTAIHIKEAIKKNKKFILIASNSAINSKWCNWELGLGDSEKYLNNIALFPIADDSGLWLGNEYLQIYPYIDKSYKSLEFSDEYIVHYPDGKKINLIQWLNQ